ncbi:MAG: RNA polymerase sigma factor [bacterium]
METNKNFLKFLDRCIEKDKDAWDTFVDIYGNPIYNYIIRTFKRFSCSFQNNEVDEIFNSIFLAVLDKNCKILKNFKGQNERSFRAYLREISFHTVVDLLRKKKNFIDQGYIQYYISTKNDYERLNYIDLQKIILALRKELPQRYNYLFKLIYEEELNFTEIAKILNIKLNALHQLKFRMIKNIIKISKKKGLYHELETYLLDFSCFSISGPYAISMN